ncbi:MAG: 16S rRNA (adenine(1518)-N(6)/adenine(1519)-N(6))-dimethyltransferase RsmA [Planctomycetota bacterium]|jgi:16S rRNA (adenine1518-N6/adenine1519-N6)-dimethyltransferase
MQNPQSPPPPRQTQSFLRDLFRQHGLVPKKALGQNFLIDINLVDLVVKSGELDASDLVLEVGTGTGSLTSRLAQQAGAVLTVEIDHAFHQLAKEASNEPEHVCFFQGDVLKNKNTINPEVFKALDQLEARIPTKRRKLIANLPYAVATPVISNLLMGERPWERMVVMVQWEIADKMLAQPGTKEYGALAILVQSLAEVEILRRLPPEVFWPRPAVDSGIIRIKPSLAKRALIPDIYRFRIFLRDLYAHRRKNLRGGLVSIPATGGDKGFVDDVLARLGYTGQERAETFTPAQHLVLCEAIMGGKAHDEALRQL